MSKTKKRKSRKKPLAKGRLLFYLTGLTLFISFSWIFIGTYYQSSHPDGGQTVKAASALPDSYKDLDLEQAAKATYTNVSLQRSRELGVIRNVNHTIVSFSVPKDNLTEFGLMTLPTTPAPPDGYPVVILCHGYAEPWAYSTEGVYLGDMEFYSRNGFAVIKPDFRGQGLSIPNGTPDGAYYSMAYNTDTLSLIAAIKATPYFNKKNINIWGHSMGGYIALRAAILSPDIKNVILLAAPVGYIQDMFSSYVAISDSSNKVAATIRAEELAKHGTPLSNPDFWNKTSPINYLNKTKAHIQIHVGSADAIVPPHFSQDLDTVLNNSHKDHEYYVYPYAGHSLWLQRYSIWSRSLELLKRAD